MSLLMVAGVSYYTTPDHPQKVFPIDGMLYVNDQPAANARLAFHSLNGTALCPVGVTGPDGSFHLTTFTFNDGAPEGEYVVTLIWPNEAIPADECEGIDLNTHDRLKGLYSDVTKSTLRARVLAQPNQISIQASIGATGWNVPRKRQNEKMSK
jgi:hypothetical protein